MTIPTAEQLIAQYALTTHPAGGYYKEFYRSNIALPASSLPACFGGERSASTAIYFLLQQGDFSAFHRIKSDEVWHFYVGDTLLLHILHTDGQLETVHLGNGVSTEHMYTAVVPAGTWFASEPAPNAAFSFVGCTVAPGFDFADFEMADATELCNQYPQHAPFILPRCR